MKVSAPSYLKHWLSIVASADSGKEALIGAVHYGKHPGNLQKKWRDTYVVQVCGYKLLEFHQDVKSGVLQIEMKKEEWYIRREKGKCLYRRGENQVWRFVNWRNWSLIYT